MKKIILGEKKYIGNQNEDNFLDIELSREIENLKIDSLQNIFDYQAQFIKERNDSLKFCVYGIVESRYGHCDNLAIKAYISDFKKTAQTVKEIIYTPYIHNNSISGTDFVFLTKPLSDKNKLSKNIYGTNKGCYFFYFEIPNKEITKTKSLFLEIFDQINELYGEFSIPILYYDEDKERIEFGTETADFDEDNTIQSINNNFPFFYDKHWVKFNLEPTGPQVVFFENDIITIKENEVTNYKIPISLEKPSEYGLEKVKIIIDYGLDEYGQPYTNADLYNDYLFTEQILTWAIGEKTKEISIDIINDLKVERNEKIVFRIIPITNTRIDINTNNSTILYIESEDKPASIYFDVPSLNFNRPLFSPTINNPNLLNLYSNLLTIKSENKIQLDLLTQVPITGEKIKIKFLANESTAKIEKDFILDILNTTNTEIIIDIPINVDFFDFSIFVKPQNGYVADKKIILELVQETLGVVPVSQSNINNKPRIEIVLKDSTIYQYTRYTIPVNTNTNTGLFKTIYYHSSNSNNKTILSKNIIDNLAPAGISQLNVTNHFTCDLEITNRGEKIVWQGQEINNNEKFIIPINSFALTNNLDIDLPANSIWQGNYYLQTKYYFQFKNFEKTHPNSVLGNSNQYLQNNNFEKTVTKSEHYAGILGKEIRYLHSTVYNGISTLNETDFSCSIQPIHENKDNYIYYGSGLFTDGPGDNYKTHTILFFDKKMVSNKCSGSGDNLPVGYFLIKPGPYVENNANLFFGKVFLQINYNIIDLNSKMFAYSVNNNNTFTNSNRYFYSWDYINSTTKENLEFEIFNNGVREVTILNKIISPGSSKTYYQSDVDFNDLKITLQSNDDYDESQNSFSKFNYKFKINNIKIQYQTLNNTAYETINSIDLGYYEEVLSQNSNQAPTIRNRFIQYRYNNINLLANIFGNFDCSGNPFTNPWTTTKNIYTNDVLLFANLGSNFIGTQWENQVITPNCNLSSIPFKIIN